MTGIQGIVQGQNAAIKIVQHGTIALTTTSNTATIDAVVTANTLVLLTGQTCLSSTTGTDHNDVFVRIALTNSTTVTATRSGSTATDAAVNFCVIEFQPNAVKSNQTGTVVLDDVTSNTVTLSEVDTTKTVVSHLGTDNNQGDSDAWDLEAVLTKIILTDSTTLTGTKSDDGSTSTETSYQVMEFY